VRVSMDHRSTRRAASPVSSAPPVTAAISAALSEIGSTGQVTRDPLRRRASAARATSTSSNGSVLSPIT
jgi:hypothetical protein